MRGALWNLLTMLAIIIVHEPSSGQRISGIAEECRYSTVAFPRSRPWVSNPPMSVSETAVTGYSCSDDDIFRDVRPRYRRNINSVQLALREAESTNSSWQYKAVLTYSCDFSECYDLWYSNFSNYLIGSATFTNLKPNTLYTMVTFTCSNRYNRRRPCTIDYARYQSSKVNISTTPLVPVFNVTVGTTSLTLHFEPNYHRAGSPPHGHEIVVWAVNEGTAPGPFSHYFELSVLQAVVKNLQPGTNYTLYVRANGMHFANNQGRWTAQSVRSLPAEPGVPTVTATVSRDTAVIVKLTPAQTFDLIERCLVSIHATTGSGATSGTEAVVEVSGNVFFIEGLLPGTEYSYQVAAMNEAGRSNFTEWVRSATTANVDSVVAGSSIMLLWATPRSLDDEDIASYIIFLSGVNNTEDTITYTLPGSRQNAVLRGLHPGVTYQMKLMTETSSGLQPFYSANVTTLSKGVSCQVNVSTLDLQTLGGVTQLVWSGVGAGVMLVIVLVVCGVSGLVCCIVWMRRRSRKVETDKRPRPMATSNPNHYMQSEQCGVSGNDNDIEMVSNPAYAGVEYTADEVHYHIQGEVGQLSRPRGEGEGRRGRGEGGDRKEGGSGGGRGEAGAGQVCDEIEVGRRQGSMYANIIRS